VCSILNEVIGPHIGLEYAWPMSLLLQAMTSDNDTEILNCVNLVKKASPLGLVHESINVNRITDYTRTFSSPIHAVTC
jgi:meiotically up-regulated gene 157 (Mug157) protein